MTPRPSPASRTQLWSLGTSTSPPRTSRYLCGYEASRVTKEASTVDGATSTCSKSSKCGREPMGSALRSRNQSLRFYLRPSAGLHGIEWAASRLVDAGPAHQLRRARIARGDVRYFNRQAANRYLSSHSRLHSPGLERQARTVRFDAPCDYSRRSDPTWVREHLD